MSLNMHINCLKQIGILEVKIGIKLAGLHKSLCAWNLGHSWGYELHRFFQQHPFEGDIKEALHVSKAFKRHTVYQVGYFFPLYIISVNVSPFICRLIKVKYAQTGNSKQGANYQVLHQRWYSMKIG